MKRRKAAKGRKAKKVNKRRPKAYRLRTRTGRFCLIGQPANLVLQQITLVEAAMADLPPDALAAQDREELTSALTVLKTDPALETPKAKKEGRRIQSIFDAIVAQGVVESGKAAVENWPAFFERLRELIELIGSLLS
jgi:hypothetical protein